MRWFSIFLLLFNSLQLCAQAVYSSENLRIRKWYESANQLIKERKFNEGISLYKKCLKREPSFIEAHWSLASVHKNLGDLEISYYHLDKYYSIADKSLISAKKLMILMRQYFNQGLYVKAKECLVQFKRYRILMDQEDSLLIASITYAFKNYKGELSMGMSGDYKIALDYGATIIRIGSKIFN